jgi:hypothetical protein
MITTTTSKTQPISGGSGLQFLLGRVLLGTFNTVIPTAQPLP